VWGWAESHERALRAGHRRLSGGLHEAAPHRGVLGGQAYTDEHERYFAGGFRRRGAGHGRSPPLRAAQPDPGARRAPQTSRSCTRGGTPERPSNRGCGSGRSDAAQPARPAPANVSTAIPIRLMRMNENGPADGKDARTQVRDVRRHRIWPTGVGRLRSGVDVLCTECWAYAADRALRRFSGARARVAVAGAGNRLPRLR
jgi:hypothetical protein